VSTSRRVPSSEPFATKIDRPLPRLDTPLMGVAALQQSHLDEVLEHVNVPSYIIDATGIVRWLNRAARNIVGDVRGRQFTSVVTPEDTLRAREVFARKVVGRAPVTDAGVVLLGADGGLVAVEVSSVPLLDGDRVVGVFGQVNSAVDARPATRSARPTRP